MVKNHFITIFSYLLIFLSGNSVYSQEPFPSKYLDTSSLLDEIPVGDSEFGFFIIDDGVKNISISSTGTDSFEIGFRSDDSNSKETIYHLYLNENASVEVGKTYYYRITGKKRKENYSTDLTLRITSNSEC